MRTLDSSTSIKELTNLIEPFFARELVTAASYYGHSVSNVLTYQFQMSPRLQKAPPESMLAHHPGLSADRKIRA